MCGQPSVKILRHGHLIGRNAHRRNYRLAAAVKITTLSRYRFFTCLSLQIVLHRLLHRCILRKPGIPVHARENVIHDPAIDIPGKLVQSQHVTRQRRNVCLIRNTPLFILLFLKIYSSFDLNCHFRRVIFILCSGHDHLFNSRMPGRQDSDLIQNIIPAWSGKEVVSHLRQYIRPVFFYFPARFKMLQERAHKHVCRGFKDFRIFVFGFHNPEHFQEPWLPAPFSCFCISGYCLKNSCQQFKLPGSVRLKNDLRETGEEFHIQEPAVRRGSVDILDKIHDLLQSRLFEFFFSI